MQRSKDLTERFPMPSFQETEHTACLRHRPLQQEAHGVAAVVQLEAAALDTCLSLAAAVYL